MAAVDPTQARTHALNVEGVFFQQHVAHLIRQEGWTITAEEYPVAFPPGNGPILGKEGRLDIRAERRSTRQTLTSIASVECKKAHPDFKDWVFFPKGRREMKATGISVVEKGAETDTGRNRWIVSPGISSFIEGLVCADARELKAEFGKPDSWKSATDRIEKACYQAAQGSQAIFREAINRNDLLLDNSRDPDPPLRVVPVVVTTANLFLCRFDPAQIATGTGEIDWNHVTFESTDVVIYEYPLPVHLQMPPGDPLKLKPQDVATYIKKDILIVKATHLTQFLRGGFLE